jgi:hypothetical protein
MYNNVLEENQSKLLDLIKLFQKDFYLAWWTAIALYLGHRKSIDFDLFSNKPIKLNSIINTIIKNNYKIDYTLVSNKDELTIVIKWVKITFLYFPFNIDLKDFLIPKIIKSPDLLTIAAMEAYAMWRRSKCKDYVDMYFLLNQNYTIEIISKKAKEIFNWAFEEKLFREQLCYFEDIDYSEQVEYIWENIDDNIIKNFLSKKAVEF